MVFCGLRIQSLQSGVPTGLLKSFMVGEGFRITELGYGGLRIQSYKTGLPKWVTEVGYRNWLPKWVLVG